MSPSMTVEDVLGLPAPALSPTPSTPWEMASNNEVMSCRSSVEIGCRKTGSLGEGEMSVDSPESADEISVFGV